ncbi:MAG: hypothetical protein ACHQQQ_01720 [Bacteroidota bacterium]
MATETTQPAPVKDHKELKEKIGMILTWIIFGGSFLFVLGRLLMEIATGR